MSKILEDPEYEKKSKEQCNREIPGDDESSVKSSFVIDDLKSKDLKSNEDVKQSCKEQTLMKSGCGIDKNFEIFESTLLDRFNSLELKVDSLTHKITESKAVTPSALISDDSKTSTILKSLNDELVSLIQNSKYIQSLENCLLPAKIRRIDSSIGYFFYCGICFDGSAAPGKCRSTKGCFTLNIQKRL